jgi:hypothetical protein
VAGTAQRIIVRRHESTGPVTACVLRRLGLAEPWNPRSLTPYQRSIDVGHADLPIISITNIDRYYVVTSGSPCAWPNGYVQLTSQHSILMKSGTASLIGSLFNGGDCAAMSIKTIFELRLKRVPETRNERCCWALRRGSNQILCSL